MKKMLLALFVFLGFSISALAAVNINTATQAELESLNGIGPVKAQAIIDYRKKNGNFKSVDDLEKVNGVGAATLQSVRKDVSISGKSTAVMADAKANDSKPAKGPKAVGNEKAAAAGKTADTKDAKATTEKKAAKADKPAKESQAVGTEKAATAGKTADVKEAKAAKTDTAKEEKAAKSDKKESKATETKTESKAKKSTKADKKAAADKKE
ncbi:ComEA family DNA-binding protein [Methylotenera mobilis]|uniref:Competence protein ComEA helix-hairpin-helix repeat protein n=1 Tax=Methylotenera mobilis (strain JLW8 / ATCC BAA-1282 / DSM 17540) TaxID=583345 RepID=C6WWX7_METML|nr:competence protein ComEA helix-hairpin-helix repeat protein [Methylotenera mobilis JLW8]